MWQSSYTRAAEITRVSLIFHRVEFSPGSFQVSLTSWGAGGTRARVRVSCAVTVVVTVTVTVEIVNASAAG